MAWPAGTLRAQTATEFLEQARQCDPSCVIGPGANRSQALALYEKALTGIEGQQRLDVLFRMGQLHGSIMDRQKGESPNYHKAIGFYQQIVESYPPEEPLVMTALGLISDHYTSLREFDAALVWAKRAVGYDTAKVEKHIDDIARREDSLANTPYTPEERQAIIEQAGRRGSLQENVRRMAADRVSAVDRIAHIAGSLDPLRAHGELRALADKYAGTPVGDQATRRLQEAMDKRPDLWLPSLELPPGPASTLHPGTAPPIALPRSQKGVETPPSPLIEIITEPEAPAPNTTAKPQKAIPLAESPRAPPLVRRCARLIVAAGLTVLGLAVWRSRRKPLSRNLKHET